MRVLQSFLRAPCALVLFENHPRAVLIEAEPTGSKTCAYKQRQQAGALQTLREFEGTVRSRGSVQTVAACRRLQVQH